MQCFTKIQVFAVSVILLLLCFSYIFWSPMGWDLDEAAILWNAVRVLNGEQGWSVYAPEFTQWEMFLGYFYAVTDKLDLPFRSFPVLLRLLEIVTLARILREQNRSMFFWSLALILFAFNPWNLYYGDVLGTCVGVVIWTLLIPRLRARRALYALALIAALMHYTSLRLLLVWEMLVLIRSRNWKSIIWMTMGLLCFALLLKSNGEVNAFFARGSYNFISSDFSDLAHRFFATLMIVVWPVSDSFRVLGNSFMGDFVHEGVRSLQSPNPLLGWGGACLVVMGLLGRVLRTWRLGWRDAWNERDLQLIFLWTSLAFLGPSASRLLLIQGLLVLFLVDGWIECVEASTPLIWKKALRLSLVLLSGLVVVEGLTLLSRRSSEAHQNLFYFSRYQILDQENQKPALLISDYGFPVARWIASRSSNLTAAPATSREILEILVDSKLRQSSPLRIFLDQVPEGAQLLTGFDQWASLKESEAFLRTYKRVLKEGWLGFPEHVGLGFFWMEIE